MPATALAAHPRHSAAMPARTCLLRWFLALALVVMAASDMAVSAQASSATADAGCREGALDHYAARAAVLRRLALETGTVSYLDVIEAAYGEGAIGRDVLEAKARWRGHAVPGLVFVTDYSTLLDAATVGLLTPHSDARLQSTLVAQYESLPHRIGIAPVASDFAIFHEAGHAMQRATLRTRGSADSRRSALPEAFHARESRPSDLDSTTLRRLEYLCSQVELEVRLQDLNRFHALLTGRGPIMRPEDAVHALLALGIPLAYEEVRDAFRAAGETISPETFSSLQAAPIPLDAGAVAIAFEDARELRIIRRLALRLDGACWTPLLAKIVFEAPGHL